MTAQRLSHIAMTVSREQFNSTYLDELNRFYSATLGWQVNQALSRQNERLFISMPEQGQYLNVRASDKPMATSGYEHLGVYVDEALDVYRMHEKVCSERGDDFDIELDDKVRTAYGGQLTTFRFRYLMPLAIEIQHIAPSVAN